MASAGGAKQLRRWLRQPSRPAAAIGEDFGRKTGVWEVQPRVLGWLLENGFSMFPFLKLVLEDPVGTLSKLFGVYMIKQRHCCFCCLLGSDLSGQDRFVNS